MHLSEETRAEPEAPTTSPPCSRELKMRQLRQNRRGRFRRKPAPPRASPQRCTACTPSPTISACITCTTPPLLDYSLTLSPITPNPHTSPLFSPNAPPFIPLTNTMNETLNDTYTHNTPLFSPNTSHLSILTNSMNETLNESHMNDAQTYLPDHSNYMNDSQSQKYIILLNGTYTHISYD